MMKATIATTSGGWSLRSLAVLAAKGSQGKVLRDHGIRVVSVVCLELLVVTGVGKAATKRIEADGQYYDCTYQLRGRKMIEYGDTFRWSRVQHFNSDIVLFTTIVPGNA
jgi:hypothetical protein